MARTVLLAIVGIVLGMGAGWVAVRLLVSGPPPPPSGAELAAVAPPPRATATPPECTPLEKELTALQAELGLTQRLLADLKADLEGVPPAWSDAVPPEHEPAAFHAVMAEVALRCPDVNVVNVDCSEPPCQAWLSHNKNPRSVAGKDKSDRLANCPAWVEAFGEHVDESAFRVCTGTEGWGSVVGVRAHKAIEAQSMEDHANLSRRKNTRADRAREEWPCGEP